MKPADKALVLLSGGQDSTTCLFWALDRFGSDAVTALSFDYGQRHRIDGFACSLAVDDLMFKSGEVVRRCRLRCKQADYRDNNTLERHRAAPHGGGS